MKEEDPSGSGLHRPTIEAQNRSCDGIGAATELPTVKMDDSQLVGAPVIASSVSAAVEVEVKRKRGRPPKGQAKLPPSKKKKDDEDVCFICFDGGSLVLCDRRACPKAYHPACIKRDEAFFRSRAKWNCGWHICSRCQKAAHYMCYTCTYSLCKACTKDADYVCVRENKGFCTTCMRTIMLIENNDQGNKAEVDFDDKSSWEYLFKIYWICLKENLSLTLDELYRAQNPWKAAGNVARKGQSLYLNCVGNDGKGSISEIPSGHLEANNSKRTKGQPNLPNKGDSLGMDKSISDNGNTSSGSIEWASKELLEFVAHMRNGDTSVLSQFDVQALLLDYIKTNNLRDPNSRNQIICDLRLRNLFGRPRVGHFEMLTLLEFHFLTKEDSPKAVIQRDIVDGGGSNDNLLMMLQDQNGKTCRKDEERGPQANLNEYAAIDFHNINLIFLRRKLMESLIVDYGKFHDKAVGSIVRIQIYTGDQKQDMHRLVQVVGTCKVAIPYKIGERIIDVILEILNLDKRETISIDAISDQEFSEDECLRLRRSIKCGLVKPLTVGQVQEKAIALQEVRFDDWLESELMRLNHLRDRASEKGHKKELRECVEKIELLKTPEERQRRLREIPDIHVDPKMDPNCESDEEDGVNSSKKQDVYLKPSYSEFSRDARESTSTQNGDISNDSDNTVLKNLTTCDQSKSTSSPFYLDKGVPSRVVDRANESSWNDGIDACGSNVLEKPGNQVDSSGSVVGGWNNQAGLFGSFSGVGSETSVASLSSGSVPPADDNEADKLYLWHYRDPNGNIQGPFCMLQLRKWSTTGYFPPDMRIWGINEEEGDSLLLTDVLNGQLCKALTLQYNNSVSSQPHETSLQQARGHDSQRWDSTSNHGNWSSPGNVRSHNIGGQSTDNRTNSQGYLAQSSGESWKPLPVNYSSTNWDSNNGFASVAKSTDASEQNFGIDLSKLPRPMPKTSSVDLECQTTKDQQSVPSNFPVKKLDSIQNLPSSSPKPSDGDDKADPGIQKMPSSQPKPTDEDEKVQATENKQSVSSNFLVQNSEPSRSRASSLVVGGEKRLPEIAGQWGGFSLVESEPPNPMITLLQALAAQSTQEFSTPGKPSVEEWDSGLVCVSSLKPPEVVSDHTATPTSQCDELSPPSSSHLASKASSWQAMVTEPIEFSTLAEESVSDLLAEVDAMAQCELPSPTWVTRCVEELFEDSKADCFTSLGGLSPPMDSGKNDVLSPTGDARLPPQPTMTDQSLGASQVDVINPVKKSGGKSSRNTEVELKTKPSNIPVNQSEASSNSQHPVASTTGQDMIDRDTARRSGATSQKTARGNANMNRTTSVGVTGRESHSRHGGERYASPRDRSLHSGDSGFSRGRPSWNKQSSFGGVGGGGGGGGGSYSRPPPPKGKRVCKFYESGHCRKGSYCDYLHP